MADEVDESGNVHVSGRVEAALLERLRNAIFWIGRGLTIKGVWEDALRAAVVKLERDHNEGEPFPARTGELPKRPVKTTAKKVKKSKKKEA